MAKGIKVTEKDDLTPICPFCNKELSEIYFKKHGWGIAKIGLYFCPHCLKTLGAGYAQG